MSVAYGRAGDVEIDLFDSDDECRLQVDFGLFGFGSTVESPAILRAWAAFMAETFRTGKFLDEHIGGGVYRRMPEKLIELGHAVRFTKDGKYDDRYFVSLDTSDGYFLIALTAEQAEHLVTALNDAVAVLARTEAQRPDIKLLFERPGWARRRNFRPGTLRVVAKSEPQASTRPPNYQPPVVRSQNLHHHPVGDLRRSGFFRDPHFVTLLDDRPPTKPSFWIIDLHTTTGQSDRDRKAKGPIRG